MHITDVSKGILGMNGIVVPPGTSPLALRTAPSFARTNKSPSRSVETAPPTRLLL